MKSGFPWSVVCFSLMIVAELGSSCGGKGGALREETAPSDSTRAAEKSASVPPASDLPLVLRIVPAGEDPERPGSSKGVAGVDEAVTQGDRIVFLDVITLPPPPTAAQLSQRKGYHPLFLVWDEKALGGILDKPHYEHRIQDVKNVESGKVDSIPVSFDELHRVWFIPLKDFFKRSEQDADPAEMHQITLELQKVSGERVRIKVRLRMIAPLPPIQAQVLPMDPAPPGPIFAQTVAREGWALLMEQYFNPTARRLVLWTRTESQGAAEPLQLRNHMKLISCVNNRIGPTHHGLVAAPLGVGGLRVKKGAGPWEKLGSPAGKWIRIELGPFETIGVAWMGELPPGLPVFKREDHRFQQVFCEMGELAGKWFRQSTQIHGDFLRKVRITDVSVPDPEDMPQGSPRIFSMAEGKVSVHHENAPPPQGRGSIETLSTSAIYEPFFYHNGIEM